MAMKKVNHRSGMFTNTFLRHRELGHKPMLGTNDKFLKGLYTSILPCTSWDHKDSVHCALPGGVFNLEFSPDGSLLVAACEKRSILMFDPLSRQLIHAVDNAHFDCVNCVRFLDSRVFATCSDDSTVALWDARNLRTRIRTLQGHSNWVKNIEFSQSDGLLVTSGFDGSIYTWDINSYTETGFMYNRVFHTNGLMRTRLNPDASKMIICTTGGYIILIHNLDLNTLREDLEGFKPNMYRLMQLSQTTIPVAASFTHLFSHRRKTNRIEFITDFPANDDAEVVSSLQVHPQGWCVLSRNVSNDESSEWTCVHDIQEFENVESDDSDFILPSDEEEDNLNDSQDMVFIGSDARARIIPTYRRHAVSDAALHFPYSRRVRALSSQTQPFRGFPSAVPTVSRVVEGRRELTVSSTDVWEALVAIREARTHRERLRKEARRRAPLIMDGQTVRNPQEQQQAANLEDASSDFDVEAANRSALFAVEQRIRQWTMRTVRMRQGTRTVRVPRNYEIHGNSPRLTHYIEEPNVGKGFIKELSFSSDGKLISSPFDNCVRLLAFSANCTELSTCVPKNRANLLHVLSTNVCHGDIVVSTKFSPTHCLLVSGCLSGKITYHQPVL